MSALGSLFAFLWSLVVQPVLDFFSPRHGLRYAHPGRAKPDPRHFPYYFQNADGLWLRWTEWRPIEHKAAVGVVFLVGGLAEHTGRYDSVARRFAERGFHVFAHDHQGQGLSEGERKYVERFSNYVDDLEQFVEERLSHTDSGALATLPRFIVGHSMGGLITTRYLMRHPTRFTGAILSAPALATNPAVVTPVHKLAARLLGSWLPKLGVDNLDARMVSRNPQVYELYVQDPGVPRNLLRTRWASEVFKSMDEVWAAPERLSFPFLVIHGQCDEVVPLLAAEKLMQTAVSTSKKICVYNGAYHELFTDNDVCERVFADVFRFVDERMRA